MAEQDTGWSRVEWARWFIEHDDVDEAARVLEPGDALELGHSDFLGLAAALARRGMSASYADRRVQVSDRAEGWAEPLASGLKNGTRKGPARQTPSGTFAALPAKKLA